MSQGPEAEISINSQGCWGRRTMALLNRSSSGILGSQQLWNGGARKSQPQEGSQANSHLRGQQSCPNSLNANGAEGQGGKWKESS